MTRERIGLLACAALALAVGVGAVSGQAEDSKKVAADALAKAIETGKKLFADKSIGTSGKSCTKCHEDPKRPKLSLAARANTYPKYDRREKKVITLGQKVNQMVVRMLKGKAEDLGSERLVAIEAYLMSISRDR